MIEINESFSMRGGRRLEGTVEVRGAKNAVFPLLAASLLTKEPCTIRNVPLIEDVFRMVELLKSIGAGVSWTGEREIKICTADVDPSKIDSDLVTKFRGSVLLLGPLLARFGRVRIPRPGGCLIGARPIDTHLDALSQLGAQVAFDGDFYEVELREKKSEARAVMNEFSVTGTENVMLLSSFFEGKTEILAADTDYQVHELAAFLRKMGAKADIRPEHTIVVEGKRWLAGADHELLYDPIEAGTFILTAAAARGNVMVRNVEVKFLELFLKRIKDFGVPLELKKIKEGRAHVQVAPFNRLSACRVQSLPYPGIPSDLLSAFGVLATQAEGVTLLHDPLYEGRLKYLEELNRMGANIIFCDPHRAIVQGPTKLRGRVLKTADIRGGAALVMAGLIAEGETVIQNVYQIDRGYEKIEERLRGIGADIKRVRSS